MGVGLHVSHQMELGVDLEVVIRLEALCTHFSIASLVLVHAVELGFTACGQRLTGLHCGSVHSSETSVNTTSSAIPWRSAS